MNGVPVSDVIRAVDLTGVFANAVLGGVFARREKLEPVGFATLALLSGLGGGLIRDVLLQHGTPVALTDYAYPITAFAGAALAFIVRVKGRLWDRVWPLIDAVALGCWAAAGAQKTLEAGLGWLPAVLLGTITAVGGGAVSDIVLRRVPTVLGGNTLYATCAAVASGTTGRHVHVGRVWIWAKPNRPASDSRGWFAAPPRTTRRLVVSFGVRFG